MDRLTLLIAVSIRVGKEKPLEEWAGELTQPRAIRENRSPGNLSVLSQGGGLGPNVVQRHARMQWVKTRTADVVKRAK